MPVWTIILAAGKGSRLSCLGQKKQFHNWQDSPIYWHSALKFAYVPQVSGFIFVFPPDNLTQASKELEKFFARDCINLPYSLVSGGSTRQESSFCALKALPEDCRFVLIHDGARPLVSPELIYRIISALEQGDKAAIPALPLTDTIKQVQEKKLKTLPRERLYSVQTPQGFSSSIILKAHEFALANQVQGPDDASLVEKINQEVRLVPGDPGNIKITNPEDLHMLRFSKDPVLNFRLKTGFGYDVHRYGQGKKMVLGGIPISNGPEIIAHSDGDVLLHALIDALLGCMAKGDLGEHFPDQDPDYQNISSGILLAKTMDLWHRQNLEIEHMDLTLICQIPKINPWKEQIKKNLLNILNLTPNQLSLKATTEEGMGFTGEKKGIKAIAVVTAREWLPQKED